jgi:DNA processing protein
MGEPEADVTAPACAAALASLPGMTPYRLAAILGRWPDPREAWAAVRAGRWVDEPTVAAATAGDDRRALADRWRRAAAGPGAPATVWARCRAAGIEVCHRADPAYPAALAGDHEAPAVLFWKGDLGALDGPRVAVVGTRRCTATGVAVARELGLGLAAAGVRVVSGLALGIDGAAHDGALRAAAAPPVGVVGSGLDVPYPRRHRRLWEQVASRGVLLGEAPPGAAPEPWRFPARNRILAALAAVVVVVESHLRGGSKLTVDAALARDIPVMAVPGSVRSPASAGTNELLAAGAAPARDVDDVLVALSLAGSAVPRVDARPPASPQGSRESCGGPVPAPRAADAPPPVPAGSSPSEPVGPAERSVLEVLAAGPATLERVALRTGLAPGAVAVALSALARGGWATEVRGWWERLR